MAARPPRTVAAILIASQARPASGCSEVALASSRRECKSTTEAKYSLPSSAWILSVVAAGGRSPGRRRPVGHRRPHLRRIALRRRRSRAVRSRHDRHAGHSRPVGEPALRGQPDRDRQRVRPDRVRHGTCAHRRWCAVAFDDAADELAHPRPELKFEERWMPPTHVETPDAPTKDMSITVGWNTAQAVGITREEMDAWAARSHQRAIAAMDAGKFIDEIVALKVQQLDGSVVDFRVDEHPRRDTTVEKLAGLKPLHPEIEGFSITAGNGSGTNDAAAAVALVERDYADTEKLTVLATVKAWAAAGVAPRDTGLGAVKVIGKVLDRAGLKPSDVTLWEINEAFASVPIAACREYGLDEELVNFSGSGCSLGHPIAASGARMVTTLAYELQRRGGGIGVAAMCAGGGQGGAVVIEV